MKCTTQASHAQAAVAAALAGDTDGVVDAARKDQVRRNWRKLIETRTALEYEFSRRPGMVTAAQLLANSRQIEEAVMVLGGLKPLS
jgi:hypothetical protein